MGWHWHQLNHMQAICTLLQKITMPAPHHSLRFLRAGCSSWHPTNSVKALKDTMKHLQTTAIFSGHGAILLRSSEKLFTEKLVDSHSKVTFSGQTLESEGGHPPTTSQLCRLTKWWTNWSSDMPASCHNVTLIEYSPVKGHYTRKQTALNRGPKLEDQWSRSNQLHYHKCYQLLYLANPNPNPNPNPDLDPLWPWLSIPGKLWSWSIHMQKSRSRVS